MCWHTSLHLYGEERLSVWEVQHISSLFSSPFSTHFFFFRLFVPPSKFSKDVEGVVSECERQIERSWLSSDSPRPPATTCNSSADIRREKRAKEIEPTRFTSRRRFVRSSLSYFSPIASSSSFRCVSKLGLIASTSSRWWVFINDCWWEDAKETSNSHPDVQALINGCRSALYISSKLACILKRKAPNYKTHRWRDHVASLRVLLAPNHQDE